MPVIQASRAGVSHRRAPRTAGRRALADLAHLAREFVSLGKSITRKVSSASQIGLPSN